jgi:hypothetical protein
MIVILIGMISILSVDYFLTSYLFSLIDPFASSIIVEGIMVAIIVGASYGIHSRLLRITIWWTSNTVFCYNNGHALTLILPFMSFCIKAFWHVLLYFCIIKNCNFLSIEFIILLIFLFKYGKFKTVRASKEDGWGKSIKLKNKDKSNADGSEIIEIWAIVNELVNWSYKFKELKNWVLCGKDQTLH